MKRSLLAAVFLIAGTATLRAQSNLSFELNRDTYYGYSAETIVQGDFNGDGKPDLVMGGGATPTTVTLRLGNGDGTFQKPLTVGQADSAEIVDLAAADLNNDGKLDIVALCIGGTFDVFYGNGNGTFEAPVSVTTVNSPRSIAVGDFNGGGLLDIAVGDEDGEMEIFNNTGAKAFTLARAIKIGSGAPILKTRAGDLNDTGATDLGVLTQNGAYVLWNNGSGAFTPVLLRVYGDPTDLNVGDLNQDGRADVMVSYNCTANATVDTTSLCAGFDVFYGQGDNKTLYSHLITDSGIHPAYQPWAADVNGDGIADIAAETISDDGSEVGLLVWMGHPDGSFSQTPQSFIASSDGAGGLVPGDWNRDGMVDFAQSLPGDAQMEIYINGGDRAACATSTISGTVTVCQPVNGTYSRSPLTVQANAYDTSKITALQEYVDNKLVDSKDANSSDISLSESLGTHFLVTKAWNAKGASYRSDRAITVYSGTPGPACPAAPGSASICLPSSATAGSPVQILANGSTADVPTAAQLYIDGKLVVDNEGCNSEGECPGGTTYVDTTQSLSAGSHDLVFKLWDAEGHTYTAQKTVTIN